MKVADRLGAAEELGLVLKLSVDRIITIVATIRTEAMSTMKTFLAVLEGICFLYNNEIDMLTSDQKFEIKSESARAVVSLKGAQVLEWDALVGACANLVSG